MAKLTIIGVLHTIHSKDYQRTVDYIKGNVGKKTAIESPLTLEQILKKEPKNPQYLFIYEMCQILLEKKAEVHPVEDKKLYGKLARLQQWYMFEGNEALMNDKRWQRFSIQRSISLIEQAAKIDCDYLVTGVFHAYDAKKMGYQNVILLSEIPQMLKEKEDAMISLYGKDLSYLAKQK